MWLENGSAEQSWRCEYPANEKQMFRPGIFPSHLVACSFVLNSLVPTHTATWLAAGGRWTLDWEAMEAAMREHPEVRLYMLCNPYNPVGERSVQRVD